MLIELFSSFLISTKASQLSAGSTSGPGGTRKETFSQRKVDSKAVKKAFLACRSYRHPNTYALQNSLSNEYFGLIFAGQFFRAKLCSRGETIRPKTPFVESIHIMVYHRP